MDGDRWRFLHPSPALPEPVRRKMKRLVIPAFEAPSWWHVHLPPSRTMENVAGCTPCHPPKKKHTIFFFPMEWAIPVRDGNFDEFWRNKSFQIGVPH